MRSSTAHPCPASGMTGLPSTRPGSSVSPFNPATSRVLRRSRSRLCPVGTAPRRESSSAPPRDGRSHCQRGPCGQRKVPQATRSSPAHRAAAALEALPRSLVSLCLEKGTTRAQDSVCRVLGSLPRGGPDLAARRPHRTLSRRLLPATETLRRCHLETSARHRFVVSCRWERPGARINGSLRLGNSTSEPMWPAQAPESLAGTPLRPRPAEPRPVSLPSSENCGTYFGSPPQKTVAPISAAPISVHGNRCIERRIAGIRRVQKDWFFSSSPSLAGRNSQARGKAVNSAGQD